MLYGRTKIEEPTAPTDGQDITSKIQAAESPEDLHNLIERIFAPTPLELELRKKEKEPRRAEEIN